MSIEAAAVKLRELRDSEMAVGRGPKPMGEDYEWIDAVIAAFIGNRVLYSDCEHKMNGVCCDVLCGAYVDGCGHIQVYPEVER